MKPSAWARKEQSGFSATMPTGYTWAQIGERKAVPDEAPEGQQVNVVGAPSSFDPAESRRPPALRREAGGAAPSPVRRLPAGAANNVSSSRNKMPVLEAAGVHFLAALQPGNERH